MPLSGFELHVFVSSYFFSLRILLLYISALYMSFSEPRIFLYSLVRFLPFWHSPLVLQFSLVSVVIFSEQSTIFLWSLWSSRLLRSTPLHSSYSRIQTLPFRHFSNLPFPFSTIPVFSSLSWASSFTSPPRPSRPAPPPPAPLHHYHV